MTEAAEQEQVEQEEAPESLLPETVWDEYDGQHVVLQLKVPYVNVTSPGIPASRKVEDGSTVFIQLPLMVGIFRVKRDQQGNVRITMLLNDPDETKDSKVRADLGPELIAFVTVTPISKPKSQIVTP